ncbi:MAG: ferrous iron transport protein B, partial [Chitinophagaceae bacterium]|nr:ferrous iron transport protein B [Chitinophagaceae bacterium]
MIRNKNIALVGNPNSGKSSLFNLLTGLNQKVGNFPGVTVDKKTGRSVLSSQTTVNIIDLPGTYSLYPKSDDEIVTFDVLFDDDPHQKIDVVVVVVDASNLKRNLLFCSQIIDIKKPVIVVLTMLDIAKRKGTQIDINGLSRELGFPVFAINPRSNKGLSEFKKQLENTVNARFIASQRDFIDNYALAPQSIDAVKRVKVVSSDYTAIHFAAVYEKLNFITAAEKVKLKTELATAGFNKIKVQAEETLQRYSAIKKIMQHCVVEIYPQQKEMMSEKIDKIMLHPLYGNLILLSVLFVMFQSIFWLARFPMEWIDAGFGALIALLKSNLPPGFLTDLFVNGILAGINGIVIFIPQIMILFGVISLLEDSGYMSRISFLTDRLMRKVGLNGKSVMPLISAVACAVPAIMAARTIENKKEKLITILITPFMSCSARLPVYTILISLIVPNTYLGGVVSVHGLVLFGMYLLGFFMALFAAFILNLFISMKERSIFLMELPVYRMPRWSKTLMTMMQKARVFVFDAGKIILIISVVLWGLSSYGPSNGKGFITETNLENSYAGWVGKKIEPIIKPIGFDWKIGIA